MTVDTELDNLFKQSSAAPIQTTVKAEELLSTLSKEVEVEQVEEAEAKEQTEQEPHVTRKERKELLADPAEKLARTLFIGNVPVTAATDRKLARDLKAKFAAFGKVESVRFRSIAFSQPGARKVAFIKAEFRKSMSTCNAYVVMETRDGALAALALNASVFAERHLRVDLAGPGDEQSTKMNTKKSVFIGNLSMEIEEEPVWRFFGQVGQVTNVRLIRDRVTNLGKGIGYVTFASKDSVELALKLAGSVLEGRPVRVNRCCKAGMVEKKKSRLARLAEEKEKKRKAIVKTVEVGAGDAGKLGAVKTESSVKAAEKATPAKKMNKKEAKLQAELATKFGQLLHKKFPFSAAISSVDESKEVKIKENAKESKVVKESKSSKTESKKSKLGNFKIAKPSRESHNNRESKEYKKSKDYKKSKKSQQ